MKFPKISVIIAARPGDRIEDALKALRKVDYAPDLIEVLVVRGYFPSYQRNRAAEKSRGEILYFLDNDSEIYSKTFQRITAAFENRVIGDRSPVKTFSVLPVFICRFIERTFFAGQKPGGEIGVVGGPNVWEKPEAFWPSMMSITMESFFAYWIMCSRFRPTGRFRWASEREFVLCNLAVKRKVFRKLGGFREELYPNEENEFLNRMRKKGFGLIYHPGALVNRPRRKNLRQILRMFLGYGRGRMEHIRVRSVGESLLYLVPLVFLFYFLGLIFYHPWWVFLPLGFYFGAGLSSALGFARRRKKSYLVAFLPFLFMSVHLSYGLGLFCGLATNLEKKRRIEKRKGVKMIKVKNFGERWDD